MRYDEVVPVVNEIMGQYDFKLTVRQIYYRCVSDPYMLFPNTRNAYKGFDRILTKARERLAVPWEGIEDRSRDTSGGDFGYGSPDEYMDSKLRDFGRCYYSRRMWDDQPKRVEVWVEKDALASLFEHASRGYRVVVFPSRGYSSFTKIMEAVSERFVEALLEEKEIVILHFTDHDPSGLDITRDVVDRIDRYLRIVLGQGQFTVPEKETLKRVFERERPIALKRIALTHEQVKRFNLEPNPTKSADVRAPAYVRRYGNECWELDALPPDELERLVRRAIVVEIDSEKWDKTAEKAKREEKEIEEELKRLKKVLEGERKGVSGPGEEPNEQE